MPRHDHTCPDCDEPLAFTFEETSGLSGWKRGDATNVTPDTFHFVCFPCRKTWKQRLDGPLTQDIVGDIAFFTCSVAGCGGALDVTHESLVPTEVQLGCPAGHRFGVVIAETGELTLRKT
jgi:hypothetical protein